MPIIYQTKNFTVEAPEQPLVTRTDGGHLTINPKQRLTDRSELSPKLAIELMYLTILTGEAMTRGLNDRGIDIGRINYQDNGNWGVFKPEGPYLHYHLYGRAKSAKINKYGEACQFPFRETGFYDKFEPLNEGDIKAIQKHIEVLLAEDRYQLSNWEVKGSFLAPAGDH
jgi:diadenosine tetraphosphate (Ap4A) HIT family hydrolase